MALGRLALNGRPRAPFQIPEGDGEFLGHVGAGPNTADS
jgi:hypothetical protein